MSRAWDDEAVELPEELAWWRTHPIAAAWLERLPEIVAWCAQEWRLELGEPLRGGVVSLTLAVRRADGSPAVLKLRFPDDESRFEPDALALWAGHGAAGLLDRDDERWAMLLERLEPGTSLLEQREDEVVEVVGGLLRALHAIPAPTAPFPLLAEVAGRWASEVPRRWRALGRPFEPELVDLAVETCLELHDVAPVVVHQDLHAGNVLRSGDEWKVIDPKPLIGDPAFDGAAILRDRHWELGADEVERLVPRRLDALAEATGYDRERLRRWGIAHTLAWGVSDDAVDAGMVACARALLRAG